MLTFAELKSTNKRRCNKFHDLDDWTPSQWSNAMNGEIGEVCAELLSIVAVLAAHAGGASNLTKKIDRVWPANQMKIAMNKAGQETVQDLIPLLGKEIGDAIIYADLLASRVGLSLEDCVRQAFNDKSAALGMVERI